MLRFLIAPRSLRFLSSKSSRNKIDQNKLSNKPSNTPRPPKDPPDEGYEPGKVEHDMIEIPEFIKAKAYRQFSGPNEILGPGAGLNQVYKNGFYFGYHRFSFVELQNQALKLRDERRENCGVQASTEDNIEDEERDDCLDSIQQQELECDKQLAAQAKEKKKTEEKNVNNGNELANICEIFNQKSKVGKSLESHIAKLLSFCELKQTDNSYKAFDCQEMVKEAVQKAEQNAIAKHLNQINESKKADAKERETITDKKTDKDSAECEKDKGDKNS